MPVKRQLYPDIYHMGSCTGITLNDFPTRSPATIRGTSFIRLAGR
jgi:hypothetical protein